MLFEICLILPLYLTIFVIFYRFRYIIKVMSDLNEMFLPENSEINTARKLGFN